VRANDSVVALDRPPGSQQSVQSATQFACVADYSIQLGRLEPNEAAYVAAWSTPRASNRDDLLDVLETQPKASSLSDEGEDAERFGRVKPVPGGVTLRSRQDSASLVQTQGFPTEPAARGDLSD
jgi:hypothetical protein